MAKRKLNLNLKMSEAQLNTIFHALTYCWDADRMLSERERKSMAIARQKLQEAYYADSK